MVPFIKTNDGTITMILKGRPYQLKPDHISYKLIIKSLNKSSDDDILKLYNKSTAVQEYVEKNNGGRAIVKDGQVYIDGNPVHNVIAQRILDFIREGLPFTHLLKFLDNLSQNPSYNSQQELYTFLEHKNLPITDDGCFLAYKAIRNDWKDKYTGTVDNSIGQKPFMLRGNVDDDKNNHCSSGFHVGALDYAGSYGSGDDRMVIVKVNPKNAVSVPTDSSFRKLRVCEYEVIAEYTKDLDQPMYSIAKITPNNSSNSLSNSSSKHTLRGPDGRFCKKIWSI
jgi:hypothetical protein